MATTMPISPAQNAVAGGGGRAHPLQGKNEKCTGDQIEKFDQVLACGEFVHDLSGMIAKYELRDMISRVYLLDGRLLLNILSMRSVIKNPPTTLLVAATMAITPNTTANLLLCSPTRTIAPTTAMASSALVNDISGVCSRGETWRMTSKPIKQASMKMNSRSIRLEPIESSVLAWRYQISVLSKSRTMRILFRQARVKPIL